MQNPSIPDVTSAESWAEVRVRDQVMRYRRAGAGPAVLVLRSADSPDALWPALLEALGDRSRLIFPDVSPAGPDVAAWLASFLEGLGVADISLIATDAFCIPAVELALFDLEQVARMVLVPSGSAEETGLGGALAMATQRHVVPLIVVRRGLCADDAVPLVTRFLGGEENPGPP